MKSFNMLLVCIALFSGITSVAQENTTFTPWADMPLEARQAVLIWNNKFCLFEMSSFVGEVRELFTDLSREAPMRVIADFNGDGIDDYALLGEEQNQQHLIMVLSGLRWSVVEVEKWSDSNFKSSPIVTLRSGIAKGIPVYLIKAEGVAAEKYKAKYKRDVLQAESYLGSTRLFGLRHKKINELKP